jgi:hypothetical protein
MRFTASRVSVRELFSAKMPVATNLMGRLSADMQSQVFLSAKEQQWFSADYPFSRFQGEI